VVEPGAPAELRSAEVFRNDAPDRGDAEQVRPMIDQALAHDGPARASRIVR
jgi:hypothetical protein